MPKPLDWNNIADASRECFIFWAAPSSSSSPGGHLEYTRVPSSPAPIKPHSFLYDYLLKEIKELRKEVQRLSQLLEEDEFVEVREVTLEQAKDEIAAFFLEHDGKSIDYVDLVDALDLPLGQIVKACEELEQEGKIASVDQR